MNIRSSSLNKSSYDIPGLETLLNRPLPLVGFAEEEILDVLKSMIDLGVELQSKRIAHRNIKPQNIILNRDQSLRDIRMINFELGIQIDEGEKFEEPTKMKRKFNTAK